jgi:hypothetical protein
VLVGVVEGGKGRLRMRTGYVIWSIERAAAASSPHIMSFKTKSWPSRSSLRRMGRPTIEGYWCSGKFCVLVRMRGGVVARGGE